MGMLKDIGVGTWKGREVDLRPKERAAASGPLWPEFPLEPVPA
jgi:hypothetical protein